MGSFYSTCSISDLSIVDGNKMYMQLILPTWRNNLYSVDGEKIGCGEKGLRVSNEGALAEFIPFGFPIDGKYADYGDISDIKPSRNIEMLEKFFGISILDIISCATDDRWYRYGYLEKDKRKERNDWIVGDNKMKNIDVLKQLTVTYFKKEHYDFLSEKWIGGNSYFNDDRDKHMKKMLDTLKELNESRPTGERKIFIVDDITDELRKKYTIVRDKNLTDEGFDQLIVELQNYKAGVWWKMDWDYIFFIPNISKYNMFKLLSISEQDEEEVRKQYIFLGNLYNLYKVLRPSYYGSQSDNFESYVEFHKESVLMVDKTRLEMKKDSILEEISFVLKYRLKDIKNKELVDSIKKEIQEGLEEYGHEIKL